MSDLAAAAEAVAEPVLDATTFDALKTDGWTKTDTAPTRAEIHADVEEKIAAKPYYWEHRERKAGPGWLCSTDAALLEEWRTLCMTDPVAAEKAGLDFRKDPLDAVVSVWIKDVAATVKVEATVDVKVP